MNKEEIQERIRYSSISYAREHGIISKEEADFILDEYVKEYRDAHSRAEESAEEGACEFEVIFPDDVRYDEGCQRLVETTAARSKKFLAEPMKPETVVRQSST